jgi:hypothetical protein
MKRLFIVDNNNEIDLNKEWLHLIPEFSKILHRRWLCEGDADGRKKVMARRIFGYIYLTVDYASPLFTWVEEARHEEAIKMMQLKPGDLESDGVKAAIEKYDEMQNESTPALQALRSMYSALRHMNEYLKTINLNAVDKQGKPLHTPASITRAVKEMNSAYDAVNTMERRVLEDLKKEANTIRGTATLGGKEGKRNKEWKEGASPTPTELQKSVDTALENGKEIAAIDTIPDFRQMGDYLMKITKDDEDSDGGEI